MGNGTSWEWSRTLQLEHLRELEAWALEQAQNLRQIAGQCRNLIDKIDPPEDMTVSRR